MPDWVGPGGAGPPGCVVVVGSGEVVGLGVVEEGEDEADDVEEDGDEADVEEDEDGSSPEVPSSTQYEVLAHSVVQL
jgi:hypothetical protein